MLHSKCHHAVNRRFASFLFCLSFANRASVSGDPYIDSDRNHPIFPAACLVCQVTSLFIIFVRSTHMHRISYLAYHAMYCIMLLVHCTMIDTCSIACVLALCRAGRWVHERGTCWVRLRGASFWQPWELCRQDGHYHRYHFYLCLLVVRSIAMSRYLPLVYHAFHIAMSSL